jgi:hypothetical protein
LGEIEGFLSTASLWKTRGVEKGWEEMDRDRNESIIIA